MHMLEVHIKKLRKRNCWTQARLATLLGMSQPTISRIEKNCEKTSWKLIRSVLIALAFDIKDFSLLKEKLLFQHHVPYSCFQLLMHNQKFRMLMFSNPIMGAEKIISALEAEIIK